MGLVGVAVVARAQGFPMVQDNALELELFRHSSTGVSSVQMELCLGLWWTKTAWCELCLRLWGAKRAWCVKVTACSQGAVACTSSTINQSYMYVVFHTAT